MTLSIRNTPVDVLEAIRAYCSGAGSLYTISSALEMDASPFRNVIEWYMTCGRKVYGDVPPEPQTLLNIILLQLLKSYRQELLTQRKRLRGLENKLQRLQTPYPG